MRERVRERAAHLRDAANAHDVAAASLEKHLGECDRLTESIAGIERRASSLVADARTRVARLQSSPDDDAVRPTATREDQALVAFAPPPSGHKDWLDVELPGSDDGQRRPRHPARTRRPPSSTDCPAGSR